jgi:DNA helicase INO80
VSSSDWVETPLMIITEDESNMYRHASRNALEALAAAKARADSFDKQAAVEKQTALERKTNEALKLAKGQAHIRDEETTEASGDAAPLVDCVSFYAHTLGCI